MKTIIEIRAGSGGEESKLLVTEQFGIYFKACKLNGFWLTILEETPSHISFSVEGKKSYETFKNESGGIQWMRHSPTDKKGRVHTSLITVAVLKVPEQKEIQIKNSELEFRFIRASSKGGQHANKTESGVIAKHIPTGLEAKSNSDRSQHVNKQLAIEVLRARILETQNSQHNSSLNNSRSNQIGSGHRSDKIRTIRVLDGTVKCESTGKIKPLKDYLKGELSFK